MPAPPPCSFPDAGLSSDEAVRKGISSQLKRSPEMWQPVDIAVVPADVVRELSKYHGRRQTAWWRRAGGPAAAAGAAPAPGVGLAQAEAPARAVAQAVPAGAGAGGSVVAVAPQAEAAMLDDGDDENDDAEQADAALPAAAPGAQAAPTLANATIDISAVGPGE